MRVLITGGAGNVAGWMVRAAPAGLELHVTGHRSPVPASIVSAAAVHQIDLRDRAAVVEMVKDVRPDAVLHAAYEPNRRDSVVDASAAVAEATARVGASMLHLSTDVVFSGNAPPYDEGDTPDPITDYGRWKAEAEESVRSAVPDVCITRTSLVPSLDPLDRATAAFASALADGRPVTLFTDEMRQPIRAVDLAAHLWALLALERTERAGVWHLPGPERLTRHRIGLRLAAALGLDAGGIGAARSVDQSVARPLDTELVGTRGEHLGVDVTPFDRR